MNYTKSPLSISDQISLLKQRGLLFNDEVKAAHYLSNISYYRLRAYTYPFQNNDDNNHPFVKQVSFEEIIELYVFDRKLRLLVFNAIEKIEIALRTKIIYEFSLEFGSHWYEDPDKYRNMDYFDANIDSLYDEIERSTETFIDHYYDNYSNPANPPAWMSLEVASLGLLSKLYSNLNNYSPKQKVSSEFGLSRPNLLSSWIHAFVNLRNLCAHYSRIWNRRFTITPIIPYNTINPFLTNLEIDSNKLYAQLSCIIYILKIISPYNNFVSTLKDLFTRSNLVKLDEMGFPENWEDEEIWKTEN